jgi:hypothetical protein
MIPDNLIKTAIELSKSLESQAKIVLEGTSSDQWFRSSIVAGVDDPLDVQAPAKEFDRQEIDLEYMNGMLKTPAITRGEAAGVRVLSDCMSAMERSQRVSDMTPVRCILHAASRRKASGGVDGLFYRKIISYPVDLINEGRKKSE